MADAKLIVENVLLEQHIITSAFLEREVIVDAYLPTNVKFSEQMELLLINDGQDLPKMPFDEILDKLISAGSIEPLLCIGIHCGPERRMEYGTANEHDYKGRGAKAKAYTRFISEELLPFIRDTHKVTSFKAKSFAGFSLGALSALDIVWNHPEEFSKVGLFSGSFWWRNKSYKDGYDDAVNRILHNQIREGEYHEWLQFFFECGTMDETKDRNNNGIIDSIDDTKDLINELKLKGYPEKSIHYLELHEGKHDVSTWGLAFPDFLKWGWGIK
ncbi:MAG: alpha/beta hydrolase-fold protein [Panacibacter sp.]